MRPIDVLRKVAPHAHAQYVQAFEQGDPLLAAAGVTTPLRLQHLLAQVLEETGGETIEIESGAYSAARIRVVWPGRPDAVQYAHNPEALFNHVYANRMGNGPPESGDGFRFRGRGLLQTTGRDAYTRYGKRCGVDFVGNPDLVFSAEHALKPLLAEWTDSRCNADADRDDIHTITRKVNGGYTNFGERVRWLGVVKRAMGSAAVELTAALAPKPVPHPAAPPAPGRPGPDPVGAAGGLGAAIIAAWQSAGHVPWPFVAAIAAVGLVAFVHFTSKGKPA
jgi:putative chitinase